MDNQELHVLAKLRRDEMLVALTTFFALVLGQSSEEFVQLSNKFPVLLGCQAHTSPCIVESVENTNGPAAAFDQL